MSLGGRLSRHPDAWHRVSNNPWVLKIIQEGLTIDFHQRPYQHSVPHQWAKDVESEAALIQRELDSLLEMGVVEEVPFVPPGHNAFYSVMFTVAKKGTDRRRPVLNLKPLNRFVRYEHFKMEGLHTIRDLIRRGDYMAKVDISNAFLHVMLHPRVRDYFRFTWKGKCYRFKAMPFGLSSAPRIFTKIMKEVVAHLRAQGVRLAFYIDDIIILAASAAECRQQALMLVELLRSLGFEVNEAKCILEPSQKCEFLGFLLDTRQMMVKVPKDKLNKIRKLAAKLRADRKCTVRVLASFIGKLVSVMQAIGVVRLHCRGLHKCKSAALALHKDWDGDVLLTPRALGELKWWEHEVSHWNGKTILPTVPDYMLTSDTSKIGWGGTFGEERTRGHWTPEEAGSSNNKRELLAACLTVKAFADRHRWQDATVEIQSDNRTTVAYLNRLGGRYHDLDDIARELGEWLALRRLVVQAKYLPGELNTVADLLSRTPPTCDEWALHPSAVSKISDQLGPFDVDLFASRTNALASRYFARLPDHGAAGVDAFRQSWTGFTGLANPPAPLIGRVIAKVWRERASAIVVTPWWRAAPWIARLQRMLIAPPVVLGKVREIVCVPPKAPKPPVLGNPRWTLVAWKISGAPFALKDAATLWSNWLSSGGSQPLRAL
eukprot:TRINITY_DN1224_c0_g2_i2.p2 TRINITY_DN1224_c0_g2~~TRINITY_DN1224_c0_g2_i2.p2  ORF type:complete len:659 (+),score=31.17 TRINITY_DN1224_c0_g2_i2:837-2813(+)